MSKPKYKIYNGKILKRYFENYRIFLLIVMFAVGLISGASLISSEFEITSKLSLLIDSFNKIRAEQGIVANFCNSLTVNMIFISINLFLAFSLIGNPIILCLPYFKGIGIGVISGYLYNAYKLLGIFYSILMIYPGAIVSTFAFILACNDSCEYSKNAYLKSMKSRGQYEKDETRVYLTRQLVFSGICVASAVLDSVFYGLFSRFFEM